MTQFKTILLFICLVLASVPVYAFEQFLTTWSNDYAPDSSSDNAVCQLCHERSNGGNGWNAYGISVRNLYLVNRPFFASDSAALLASLDDVEDFLSDSSNSQSPTFLEEINANTQPGWRVGNVNTITFKPQSGVPSKTINPPSNLPAGVLIDQGSTGTPDPVDDPQPSSITRGNISLKLETVASGFVAPVYATPAPSEQGFLYVVEQGGKIWKVNLSSGAKQLFLDLSAKVVPLGLFGDPALGGYDERGLLGLAFHPDYASNNKIYTYISEPYQAGRAHFSVMPANEDADHLSVVSEWIVVNPLTSPASASNERELLIIEQPQFNHNGGMLDFGPDGLLYISTGDGGNRDDQGVGHGDNGNGRDFENPLGAILRIDINATEPENGRYGIPQFNPFQGVAGLDEIIAYGFRNPYRFSFEPSGNSGQFNFWVGDVGQNEIEEIDRIPSNAFGGNYGWNYKEGSLFFYPSESGGAPFVSPDPPPGVALPNLVDPVAEYDHDEGISVIGGYVYSGSALPNLNGRYVFGDYGRNFSSPSGRLFYLNENDDIREFRIDGGAANIFLTSFAQDLNQELYVLGSRSIRTDSNTGTLSRLVESDQIDELCVPIKTASGAVSVICL